MTDYWKPGQTAWRHDYPGGGSQHPVAFDPANGNILWHAGLSANISNGPETLMLDRK